MRKLLALLFALALFVPLAACGGGDDDEESGTGSASASSTEDEEGEGEEEDESGDDSSAFCEQVEEIAESDLSDDLDFEDPEALEAAVGALEDLRGSAPSAIEDDFDVVLDFFDLILENFDDFNDPEQQAELQEEFAAEITAFSEATSNLDEFALDECGITIDGSTDDTTDATDGSGIGDDGEDTSLEDFADDVEACEGGDMGACDVLYAETPFGSEAEAVARECGGEDPGGNHTGDCEATFG